MDRMILFRIVWLLIFIGSINLSTRAQSFITHFASTEDDMLFDGLEIPQGGYLVYLVKGTYSPDDPGRVCHRDLIFKLDTYGNVVDSIEFCDAENFKFRANGLIKLPDQFIFWGSTFTQNNLEVPVGIRMIRMDYQFNILHDTSFQNHGQFINPGNMILNSGNHLVLPGSFISEDYTDISWFVREMTLDGITLKERTYTEPMPYQSVVELTTNPRTYHLIDFNRITEVDSNFSFVQNIYSLGSGTTTTFTNIFDPKAIDSASYLVSGNCLTFNFTYQGAWGLMENNTFTDIFNFGAADTSNYNAGIDFLSPEQIFSSLSRPVNVPTPTPFVTADNEMLLYCSSINNTINWELRYGSLGYILAGLPVATSDAGCLWLGNYWDWHHKTNNDFDAILLKINPDGTLITGMENLQIPSKQVNVFPNPGYQLEINTAVDHSECILYNSLNQVVIDTNLTIGENKLSSEDLPAGIYYYQVEYQSKIIDSGIWIKKSY